MSKIFLIISVFVFSKAFAQTEVELLKQLVTRSSGTNDIEGVSKVQNHVANEFKKLGFKIEEYQADDSKIKSKQVVAVKTGKSEKFITFVSHADTVFEKLNHFTISPDGKEIKGSGVGDNKGGLVVGFFAIKSFLEKNPNHQYSLRFVISPSEELGSLGFRSNLRKFSEDSSLILGLEPAMGDGSIVKARKGIRWYTVKVTGLEAHAGVSPEIAVNACHQLSIFVEKMMALNDFKKGNTISVGKIEGGKDKFNIACGSAEARFDVRFVGIPSRDKMHKKIEAILKNTTVYSKKTGLKPTVTHEIVMEVPPFAGSKQSQKFISQYQKIVKEIEGQEPEAKLNGGAADLNYMDAGTPIILDGLGPVGGSYHTIDEYVVVSSLTTRGQALVRFLLDFENKK